MTLGEFADLAEIVGALGVLMTLIFLAVQLRKNSLATRLQGYNNIVARRSSVFAVMSENREMTEIWITGLTGEDFDGVDSTRFTIQMINLMSHFQDVYLQYRSGIVEKQIWEAERKILGANLSQPGFKHWWEESSQYFMSEFIQEVSRVGPVSMVEFDRENQEWRRPGGAYLRDKNPRT